MFLVGHLVPYEGFSVDEFPTFGLALEHYDWCKAHGYTDKLFISVKVL